MMPHIEQPIEIGVLLLNIYECHGKIGKRSETCTEGKTQAIFRIQNIIEKRFMEHLV